MLKQLKVLILTSVFMAGVAKADISPDQARVVAGQITDINELQSDVNDIIIKFGTFDSRPRENEQLGQMSFEADSLAAKASQTDSPDKIKEIWSQAMTLKKELQTFKTHMGVK